jgi:hypothetical protein
VAELGSSQGRACAGGRFGRIDGEPCDFLAEWNGTSWSAIGEPTRAFLGDSRISTFEEWTPPGTQRSLALVGGRFARAGSVAARGVAAWDGASWSALGHGFDGTVTELEPVEDPALGGPALVAIGDLDADASWNGEDIALWDGASWSPIPAAPTGYQGFYDVVVFRAEGAASDTLVVASSSAARVAQWDGAAWTSIGNGFNSGVYVLAVYDAPGPTPNSVYAGGNFSVLNGAPATPVVRWDGASWSNVPGIASSSIGSLFVWDDGGGSSLYACTAGGSRVYRHAGAGWIDMSPPSGTNSVDEFTSFDDGAGDALFLGTRWRWQGGTWSSYDADLTNNGAYALRGFGPGSPFGRALVLGGPFSRIGTTPSARIARLSDPCFALTSYCTAKINSQGCTPSIGWNGEPSVGASATTPFEITASNVLNHKSGILFYGVFGRTAVPFQGGLNCVHSPVHRTPLRSSGGNVGPDDCSGVYTIDFTPWIDGTNDPLLHVGVTVDAQWWSRDPASASTTGLTNAIEFEIRP